MDEVEVQKVGGSFRGSSNPLGCRFRALVGMVSRSRTFITCDTQRRSWLVVVVDVLETKVMADTGESSPSFHCDSFFTDSENTS